MSGRWYQYYKERYFSKKMIDEETVLYRVQANAYIWKKAVHKAIAEISERVMEPYPVVYTFIRRKSDKNFIATKRIKQKKIRYESEKGLADDIYDWMQRYGIERVWKNEQVVALRSQGHHRELLRYLCKHCWRKNTYNPYWDGNFFMCGINTALPDMTDDEMWQRIQNKEIKFDLVVQYHEAFDDVGIDFLIHKPNFEKEKYIYELVQEVCMDHGIDLILDGIDPQSNLGYDE